MPGQFINTGTNPGGKLSLTNVNNQGNLTFVGPPPPPPTYTIGQAALGGIIIYINGGGSSGTSGLVVSSANLSDGSNITWGCQGTSISTSTALGTGNQNTINIMAGCATAGIAARLCGDFVSGGYSDWYLPSRDELNIIYVNKNSIPSFNTFTSYWSSSQSDSSNAWTQFMVFGQQDPSLKSNLAKVRAVRSF